MVDEHGLSVRLIKSLGQQHDSRAAGKLLDNLKLGAIVIDSRAYAARAGGGTGAQTCNPTPRYHKQQRVIYPAPYRPRNLGAHVFNKIKHFRRIAMRYDKLPTSFLAAVATSLEHVWQTQGLAPHPHTLQPLRTWLHVPHLIAADIIFCL